MMRVVVIGGAGRIGSRLVSRLREHGHQTITASRATGVNSLTGEGLSAALQGAEVVVDVSNSPSFEDMAALEFFETSTRNILAAEAAAGVGHHVALSIVGAERLAQSGYFRAKHAQETLIASSSIPYSIVRATQLFEFIMSIADAATVCSSVRLAPVLIQPIAADDAAAILCEVVAGSPRNGTVEVAGPLWFRLDDLVRQALCTRDDRREVIADSDARFFGATLYERTLLPDDDAQLATTRFDEWVIQHPALRAACATTHFLPPSMT